MRPRIWYEFGSWWCTRFRDGDPSVGKGSTPAFAYLSWLAWHEVTS